MPTDVCDQCGMTYHSDGGHSPGSVSCLRRQVVRQREAIEMLAAKNRGLVARIRELHDSFGAAVLEAERQ